MTVCGDLLGRNYPKAVARRDKREHGFCLQSGAHTDKSDLSDYMCFLKKKPLCYQTQRVNLNVKRRDWTANSNITLYIVGHFRSDSAPLTPAPTYSPTSTLRVAPQTGTVRVRRWHLDPRYGVDPLLPPPIFHLSEVTVLNSLARS
jgi:hypothetical protein